MAIRTLLIANRGEIACRIMRTARQLGMRTIAVYSDADAAAHHVGLADVAVRIGPALAAESYLRGEAILAAAAETGADAIHPGYGFLSENADFAETVVRAGLRFVGPPPAAIRAMGLKDQAKALMQRAGVPVVPGYHGSEQDPKVLLARAEAIGFPVLIKARAGGGGKGMRRVERPEDFAEALAGAQREGQASFGDPHCLLEKYVTAPRHIEVQVFGDQHGNVVHLFERDCSLQRRHQKVIEEAPAPGMTPEVRAAMGEAAVRAARAVGYEGAGTVEFIADGAGALRPDGFWFMEMNTRLQVEHPVTEAVTGLDLVALQLAVADGEALPFTQTDLTLAGHAVEARLYAENPEAEFLPTTGRLNRLVFPAEEAGVRIDTGVVEGDIVSPHYDPMLAKLVAHGPDRVSALRKLARALSGTAIQGLETNRGFLQRLAEHPEFATGPVDTGFIARERAQLAAPTPQALDWALAALAVLLGEDTIDAADPYAALMDFRLFGNACQRVLFALAEGEPVVVPVETLPDGQRVVQTPLGEVRMQGLSRDADGRLHFVADGRRDACFAFVEGESVLVQRAGVAHGFSQHRPASGSGDRGGDVIQAPMPGLVQQVRVRAGETLSAGQVVAVLEAMKMEHSLKAPRDGVLAEVCVAAGDQVEQGATLFRLADAGTAGEPEPA